ncbi:MAG: hypothetical protein AMXMBFR84_21690 [Candidatus Hydrogenedentota bacterium]
MNSIVPFPSIAQTERPLPWLVLMLLTIAFFIALHDPMRSYSIGEDYLPTEDTLEKHASEGNAKRQIGFLMVGGIGTLILLSTNRRPLIMNGGLAMLIAFFMCWISLSILWADQPALTGRRLIVIATLAVGALAVVTRLSLRELVLFVFFSSLAYLLIGIASELALGTFRPTLDRYRFSGTIHPNNQGVNCSLILLSGITAALTEKKYKLFFAAMVGLALAFLLLTKSRTSLISFLVALSLFVVVTFGHSRHFAFAMSLLMTAVFSVLLLASDTVSSYLSNAILLGRTDQDVSGAMTLTGRLPLWQHLLEYAAERPIQGYGYGSFFTVDRIRDISAHQDWPIAECHSVFLEVLLGLGIVGVTSYAMIQILGFVRTITYARATGDTRYAFLGSLLLLGIVGGLAESTLLVPTMQTFVQFVTLAFVAFQMPSGEALQHSRAANQNRFSAPPIRSLRQAGAHANGRHPL